MFLVFSGHLMVIAWFYTIQLKYWSRPYSQFFGQYIDMPFILDLTVKWQVCLIESSFHSNDKHFIRQIHHYNYMMKINPRKSYRIKIRYHQTKSTMLFASAVGEYETWICLDLYVEKTSFKIFHNKSRLRQMFLCKLLFLLDSLL